MSLASECRSHNLSTQRLLSGPALPSTEHIIAALPVAVVVSDAQDVTWYANVETERMFGVRVEDLVGQRTLQAQWSPGVYERIRSLKLRVITEGGMEIVDVPVRTKDARWMMVRHRIVRITGPDGVPLALATLADVTHETSALRQLQNIGHEVKPLLGTIALSLKWITDHLRDLHAAYQANRTWPLRIDERLIERLDQARLTAEDCAEVMNITIGQRFRGQREGNAVQVMAAVEVAVRRVFGENPNGIVALSGDDAWADLPHRATLTIIACNLLTNSVKYRHPDRALRVDVRCSSKDEQVVSIRFTDNGKGIPQHDWSRVFERGVRLDRGQDGDGWGLAIVKDSAERYGGSVRIEHTATGEGVSFVVELPRANH